MRILTIGTATLGCSILQALVTMNVNEEDIIMVDPNCEGIVEYDSYREFRERGITISLVNNMNERVAELSSYKNYLEDLGQLKVDRVFNGVYKSIKSQNTLKLKTYL